jgi:CDP-diacylglycerol--glycerol-3-phosphate 3-phosphatidyltransferase
VVNRRLPNQLTAARIALAAVFFVLLGLYEPLSGSARWVLNAAFVIYIVAGITDVLDGWIARKYDLSTAFGRVADPVTDKVLVVGAFAMLVGSNYVLDPRACSQFERDLPRWVTGGMSSAVQCWMVVVIMAREFLVSTIRGYSESRGIVFQATAYGKIKMFVQSVAICTVLYQLANVRYPLWAVITKITVVWVAVIVTALTGLAYIGKARKLLGGDGKD